MIRLILLGLFLAGCVTVKIPPIDPGVCHCTCGEDNCVESWFDEDDLLLKQ
jgi:hypothetical protein